MCSEDSSYLLLIWILLLFCHHWKDKTYKAAINVSTSVCVVPWVFRVNTESSQIKKNDCFFRSLGGKMLSFNQHCTKSCAQDLFGIPTVSILTPITHTHTQIIPNIINFVHVIYFWLIIDMQQPKIPQAYDMGVMERETEMPANTKIMSIMGQQKK